jgi:hypothetical protein
MPLTRSFKEFVGIRIERDPKFRQALFQEAVQTLIEGEVETAKSVLRDCINATIGFPALAKATRMPPTPASGIEIAATTGIRWRLAFITVGRKGIGVPEL